MRVAVITGGAGELGRVIAAALIGDGFAVHLVDRDEGVVGVASGLGATGHVVDLLDPDALGPLLGLERVDLLVNGVGAWPLVPFDELTPERWRQLVSVNLDTCYFASWACRGGLRAASGAIVNIASAIGIKGHPELLHYASAKAGMIGLTRSLAQALGADGVRVNAVAPGLVTTEANARLWGARQAMFRGSRALDMDIEVEHVVSAVRYLGSPEAAAVTGQTLVVDGGTVLH